MHHVLHRSLKICHLQTVPAHSSRIKIMCYTLIEHSQHFVREGGMLYSNMIYSFSAIIIEYQVKIQNNDTTFCFLLKFMSHSDYHFVFIICIQCSVYLKHLFHRFYVHLHFDLKPICKSLTVTVTSFYG